MMSVRVAGTSWGHVALTASAAAKTTNVPADVASWQVLVTLLVAVGAKTEFVLAIAASPKRFVAPAAAVQRGAKSPLNP